jgi:hypothetical protein
LEYSAKGYSTAMDLIEGFMIDAGLILVEEHPSIAQALEKQGAVSFDRDPLIGYEADPGREENIK